MPNIPTFTARNRAIGDPGLTADVNADSAQIANITTWINGRDINSLFAYFKAGTGITLAIVDNKIVISTSTDNVITVPGAPISVTATAGNNSASITWAAPSSNGGAAITAYSIYRNGSTTALATGLTSLVYSDSSAQNGNSYTYQVSASNSVGEGPKSTASNAVTPVFPTPVISMPALPNKQVGDASFSYTPTSTNTGVAIVLTSSNSSIASVSGNSITVNAAGSYTITASQAAGNGYAAGTASQQGTITSVPVPPSYSTILSLSVPSEPSGECTIAISDSYPDLTFQFTAAPGGNSTAKNMTGYINGNFAFSLDFPATYTDTTTPYRVDTDGIIYVGNFVDGNVTLTPF